MQTHSPNDSSELFTGFLDKQIDYLFKINTIPGWTIWTLVGALVTLIWLAFKEVTTSSPSIYAAIVIFLYLSYLSSLFPIKESNTKINTGVMRFGIFNEVLYGKQCKERLSHGIRALPGPEWATVTSACERLKLTPQELLHRIKDRTLEFREVLNGPLHVRV